MKRRTRRGVSLGTVVMLTITCFVLVGYCVLLPRMSGDTDVRINASELAVALDQSILSFADGMQATLANTPLPRAVITAQPPSTQPIATVAPATKLSFTFCASGCINLNTAVRKALTDNSGYRFDLIFENLSGLMASDLTVASLCNAVVSSEKLSDTNAPPELLTSLRASGINALCMGYFGALDYGIGGVAETRQSIQGADMLPYGVYASAQQRSEPPITAVNGVSVAMLSYQSELSAVSKKKASPEEQGFATANLQLPVIAADIKAARARGAQVVIVSLCWGKSTAVKPTDTQKQLAQGIADAGADVILGTHPEAVQSVEIITANRGDDKYHPVLCAYSLGNLFTHNREKRASLAGILVRTKIEYDPATGLLAFDDLSYTPTYCWRGKEDGVQRYRVLSSSASTLPEYVDKDQAGVMERCLNSINDVMLGSIFQLKN